MLLGDAVDLVEIIQVVGVHSRPRDIGVVHIRRNHVAQTVKAPIRALHILPGVVKLRIDFDAEFADHAEFRSALRVIIRDLVAPGNSLGLVRNGHVAELLDADFPFGSAGIRGQADAGSRNDVDAP